MPGWTKPQGSAGSAGSWAWLCSALCKEGETPPNPARPRSAVGLRCRHPRLRQGPVGSLGFSPLSWHRVPQAGRKLEVVRHGDRSAQGRAWGQPGLPTGMWQPRARVAGSWAWVVEPCKAVAVSCLGPCCGVSPCPPAGWGQRLAPPAPTRGHRGCVRSWERVAVPCLAVPCRAPVAAARGSAVPTAPQPEQ